VQQSQKGHTIIKDLNTEPIIMQIKLNILYLLIAKSLTYRMITSFFLIFYIPVHFLKRLDIFWGPWQFGYNLKKEKSKLPNNKGVWICWTKFF